MTKRVTPGADFLKDLSASDRVWIAIAAVFHLIGAYFSQGYLTPDEHFQILEFLNYKLGLSPSSDLALEYSLRARPFIQVGTYFLLIKPLTWLGISNPFTWAFILRLFSSAVAMVGMTLSIQAVRRNRFVWAQYLAPLSACLWFLPAFHARTSQENLGGAILLIGVTLFSLKDFRFQKFLAAFLIWLSFEFRFQLIFPVGALFIWMIFYKKISFKPLLGGAFVAFLIARGVDYWGYSEWSFPFLNYFKYNFIDQKFLTKSAFAPLDYFRSTTTESWPLLGIGALVLSAYAWIKQPLHPYSLATWPLFVAHSLISYKEFRFIIPIAHFIPFLILIALESNRQLQRAVKFKFLLYPLIGFNFLALFMTTLVPVRSSMPVLKKLYELSETHTSVSVNEPHPYNVGGVPLNFYKPKNLEVKIETTPFSEWQHKIRVLTSRTLVSDPHCHTLLQSPPAWVTEMVESDSFQKYTFGRIPPDRIGRTAVFECL